MWIILDFYYLKDMLVEVRNMIVISSAFHLKVLRNNYGKILRFRNVKDAKYFLKKMGMNEFDYNFVEIGSEEIFTREEVDELCRNANNLSKSTEHLVTMPLYYEDPPQYQFNEYKTDMGIFRISRKPYIRSSEHYAHWYKLTFFHVFKRKDKELKKLELIEYFNTEIDARHRVCELSIKYSRGRLYRLKNFRFEIERCGYLDITVLPRQALYFVTKVDLIDFKYDCKRVVYEAKFYRNVDADIWESYPYFNPKQLSEIK